MDNTSAAFAAGAGSPVPGGNAAAATVDARGTVLAWSRGAQLLFGYSVTEAVGRSVVELVDADVAGARGLAEHLRVRALWSGEVATRHRRGYPMRVRLIAQPLTDARGQTQWHLTVVGLAAEQPPEPGPEEASAQTLRRWALEQLPMPVTVYDTGNRIAAANAAMVRFSGVPESELLGKRLVDFAPHSFFAELDQQLTEARDSGETRYHELHGRLAEDVREHAWASFLFPLTETDGRVHAVAAVVFDITEQYWARRRLSVLNDASARIGSTLDPDRTAQEMVDVLVPQFADFVGVGLLDSVHAGHIPPTGRFTAPFALRWVAYRSTRGDITEALEKLRLSDTYPPESPYARCMAEKRVLQYRSDDPEITRWMTAYPERVEVMHGHEVRALAIVPLTLREGMLGVAVFLQYGRLTLLPEDDVLLIREIADKAAVRIDNALRYTRERTTALTLQRSLLPQRLPSNTAVDVATRYRPAGAQFGIGGDWYDVIPLSSARVALVVGDVVGHGLHASATMGRLRTAVRTLADVDLAPEELLTHLDDLVMRLNPEEDPYRDIHSEIGATCLYAIYDPVSRRCAMARAGHPPPAVVRPDGTVDFVDLPAGPPLGVDGLPFETVEFDLPPDSLLVLYTDGLVESRGHDIDTGLGTLRDVLAEPLSSPEAACDAILAALLPDRPADDTALLVARTHILDSHRVATWDLPSDPAIVGRVRAWTTDRLTEWGLQEMVFTTELLVSELVTNAIRYASAPIQLRLIRNSSLICEVSDASNTAPHLRRARSYDEGGRGLFLVAQLSQRWGTRHKRNGKTIWAEQLLPPNAPELDQVLSATFAV